MYNQSYIGRNFNYGRRKITCKTGWGFLYPIYFENDFSFLAQALKDEGLCRKKCMCIVSDSTVAPL